jgi:hypothetical protein
VECNSTTRRCRCGGRFFLVKNSLIIALCFNCLKFNYFRMEWFAHKKSCELQNKTSLIYSRSTNEIFSEQLLRKNKTKTERENSCSQPPNSSGINIPRDCVTTIYNQRHQHKLSKKKNRNQCCPTFMPGKYSQASTSVAPGSIR